MNILHLLSQNHLTGSEVYAANLIEHQILAQHSVYQVSNGFFVSTLAQKTVLAVEAKSKIQFWKNVLILRQILCDKKIHILHTHSRAAAKMAFWARLGLPIGLVSTIHGRQHVSISKKLINTYGDFLISVCENIEQQLRGDFKYAKKRLAVIRNPLSKRDFYFSEETQSIDKNLKDKKIKIALVGRTTGPKKERTEQILNALPALLKGLKIEAEIFLVGGLLSDLKLSSSIWIQEIKTDQLTTKNYENYDLIIGSGRVALEALTTGIPLIAFGEASYLGLCRKDTLPFCFSSNFGDIDLIKKNPELPWDQLKKDFQILFMGDLDYLERKKISDFIQNEFNEDNINRQIFRFYESSYFLRNYPKWIPILMYHKIPNEELKSQHKIFVTSEKFKKHLQFFKSQGFKTLTFSELKKFKSGQKDFQLFPKKPLVLTFDDGYKDNLDNASPLLTEFGFKAQLFLLANPNISSNHWDHSETEKVHDIVAGSDRLKWKDSAFEIGSHGFSHEKITEMSETESRYELSESKRNLEKEFQTEIPVFAFTYGDTSEASARWAFEEGYDYAVNTDSGGFFLEENPYQIFRVNIFPNETILSLWKKTRTWYRYYYFFKRKK